MARPGVRRARPRDSRFAEPLSPRRTRRLYQETGLSSGKDIVSHFLIH